jgi:hypothetical protein
MTSHLHDNAATERQILEDFSAALLSQSKDCGLIIEAAEHYSDNMTIQLYAHALSLYDMSGASFNKVSAFAQSLESRSNLSVYQRQLTWALAATANKEFTSAMTLLEDITTQWPEDLVSFKLCEYLYFITGFKASNQRFLDHSTRLLGANQGNGCFLGSHAFALSLTEQYEEAKTTAYDAIDKVAINPWSHHALGHIYLATSAFESGENELVKLQPLWEESGWPALCHNTWHLLLFKLAQEKYDEVLDVCFDKLWLGMCEHQFVHIDFDIISLLWRLDLAGRPAPSFRFSIFAEHLEPHLNNYVCAYQVAHYLFVLVKSGDTPRAESLIEQIEKEGTASPPALVFLNSIVLFSRQEYQSAALMMGQVLENIPSFGGSDGQIDLFYQTYFHCLGKSGEKAKADAFKKRAPCPALLSL